jgi:hypothetical protein
MKIAVVGSGIIGYVASSYLSDQGHTVDCISPKSKQTYTKSNEISKSKKYHKPVSPKFERPDFIENSIESESYFPKSKFNFIGTELINEIGLAKFWGANLAVDALAKDIENLHLSKNEKLSLEKYIPILNVQNYYEKNINNPNQKSKFSFFKLENRKLSKNFFTSKLAIFSDKINPQQLPDDRPDNAIFGSYFQSPKTYNRVDAKVEKIIFNSDGKNPFVLLEDSSLVEYDYIIVACGAIGSYRLILNSLKNVPNYNTFSRLKHHPLVSTICLVPKIRYPNKFISMSNFDFKFSEKNAEGYLNFFPLYGAVKAIMRNRDSEISKKTILLISKIKKLIDKLPDNPLFPGWWIHRLYVVNIYFQSDFSASFINYEKGMINLFGGFRFDFEKTCLRSSYPLLIKTLLRKKIFSFLPFPILAETGADLHYSSTLTNYVDENGLIKKDFLEEQKVIIVDSSSTNYLPNPNPTYYFMARAIKLLRGIKN